MFEILVTYCWLAFVKSFQDLSFCTAKIIIINLYLCSFLRMARETYDVYVSEWVIEVCWEGLMWPLRRRVSSIRCYRNSSKREKTKGRPVRTQHTSHTETGEVTKLTSLCLSCCSYPLPLQRGLSQAGTAGSVSCTASIFSPSFVPVFYRGAEKIFSFFSKFYRGFGDNEKNATGRVTCIYHQLCVCSKSTDLWTQRTLRFFSSLQPWLTPHLLPQSRSQRAPLPGPEVLHASQCPSTHLSKDSGKGEMVSTHVNLRSYCCVLTSCSGTDLTGKTPCRGDLSCALGGIFPICPSMVSRYYISQTFTNFKGRW